MRKPQIVIVGAGIAGAATAWSLKQAGIHDILVVERSCQPGLHATKKNAGILRTAIENPSIKLLAKESKTFYKDHPEKNFLSMCGLFLTAEDKKQYKWLGEPNNEINNIQKFYPDFAPPKGRNYSTWLFEDEGLIDSKKLLDFFLRDIELVCDAEVFSLIKKNNTVYGINTKRETIECQTVILAQGGWANGLCSNAGIFLPKRRHLITSPSITSFSKNSPVVWNLGEKETYFRPLGKELLLSICDNTLVPPEEGERVDDGLLKNIKENICYWFQTNKEYKFSDSWAGLRTFGEDNSFVIGPDPKLKNLFWCGGLGGHGITTAYAAGQLAAKWVTQKKVVHPCAEAFSPKRLFDFPRLTSIK